MRAFVAEGSRIIQIKREIPKPGPGEVLIRVAAFGVNRADLQQVAGEYNPPPGVTDVLGLELAGTVEAIGAGVSNLKVGDTTMALVSGGAYAESCIANATSCLPVPQKLSLIEAAALPEALFTSWLGLMELGRLQPTETTLVQGASGGVGLMACQMGRAFGKDVVSVCSTPEKAEITAQWGATETWFGSSEEIRKKLEAHPQAIDVILDYRGASLLAAHMTALRKGGRLVMIEDAEGTVGPVDFDTLILKRLSLMGSVLRSRPESDKARIAQGLQVQVLPLLESGSIRPTVSEVFATDQIEQAHDRMRARQHWGKLVIRW